MYDKNVEWHTTSYVEDLLNASFPNGSKRHVEVKIILELGHFIVMVEHIRIDSLDRANVLHHHFSSVFITEEDASFLPTVHDHDIPTMYSITINLVMRRDSSFCKTLRTAKFRMLAYVYIFKSL